MTLVRYLTISELSARLGRAGQKPLMRYLLNRVEITVIQVGRRGYAINPRDIPRLRAELRAWERRPRVVRAAS